MYRVIVDGIVDHRVAQAVHDHLAAGASAAGVKVRYEEYEEDE